MKIDHRGVLKDLFLRFHKLKKTLVKFKKNIA